MVLEDLQSTVSKATEGPVDRGYSEGPEVTLSSEK